MSEVKLPPLPQEFEVWAEEGSDSCIHGFTAEQMTDYGLACQADLVERVQELEAAAKLAMSAMEGSVDNTVWARAIKALRKAGIQ